MSTFKAIAFSNTAGQNEILIAFLDQLAFDSFEQVDDNHLTAYIPINQFNQKLLDEMLSNLEIFSALSYEASDLADKNWNQEWEKSFNPIRIGENCIVRAPFHQNEGLRYELVIEPKMAFGTGHHATTEMVMALMLDMDFEGKEILDFGCGTGILSLLAEKMGARDIQANDIEEPAFHNTRENAELNQCTNISPILGGMENVPVRKYDIILANITTNTIKENLVALLALLKPKGHILLSGILLEQEEEIKNLAQSLQLDFMNRKNKNNWVALHYSKL